jgi:hypothetical protein
MRIKTLFLFFFFWKYESKLSFWSMQSMVVMSRKKETKMKYRKLCDLCLC